MRWFTANRQIVTLSIFKGTRLHVKSNPSNTIVLDSIVFGSQIRWSRGKKINIGFEIIVFGQILPHIIGVSDLRSPNSQIQFRYTPNTMPIKDGLTTELYFPSCHSCAPHTTPYYVISRRAVISLIVLIGGVLVKVAGWVTFSAMEPSVLPDVPPKSGTQMQQAYLLYSRGYIWLSRWPGRGRPGPGALNLLVACSIRRPRPGHRDNQIYPLEYSR